MIILTPLNNSPNDDHYRTHLHELEQAFTYARLDAEKQLKATPQHPWSLTLQCAYHNTKYWKYWLLKHRQGTDYSYHHSRLTYATPFPSHIPSLVAIKEKLHQYQQELKQIKVNDHQYSQEHLKECAQMAAQAHNTKSATAI